MRRLKRSLEDRLMGVTSKSVRLALADSGK
jgi:hypothetical protein